MILAVVQARLNSTRLPRKALKEILGKPMLWHIIKRIEGAKLVDKIVIATTTKDKEIIDFAKENKIDYYAGSENDIVGRLYETAKKFDAEAIVRITGDCPLVEPEIIDEEIRCYVINEGEVDFISNIHPRRTYPDGLDVEIYPFKILEIMHKKIKDKFLREWIYTYIIEKPDKFQTVNIENRMDLSEMRWTVDYQEDLIFVREIYKYLYKSGKVFHMEDILKLLEKKPELMKINEKFTCDEAYVEALKKREK